MPRNKLCRQENKECFGVTVRLYPTPEQATLICKTVGCKRKIYNHFLALREKSYHEGKEYISVRDQYRMLAEMKQLPELEYLKEVDKFALQNAILDLDDAYANFFDHRAKKPKFKSKHKGRQSYKTNETNRNVRFHGNKTLQLPKLGKVKCLGSEEVLTHTLASGARTKSVTVSMRAGNFYASVLFDTDAQTEFPPEVEGKVGVDLGIKTLAMMSDGTVLSNPKHYEKMQKKLAKVQRKLAKQQKGSGRYKQTKKKLGRLHLKVANQRKYIHHKLSQELTDENQVLALENLNIRGMVKNKRLAKSIYSCGWYQLRTFISYKAKRKGRTVVVVGRNYASTKICSHCKEKNPLLTLSDREWICPKCRTRHDRDKNAAINILNEGLRLLASA